ncbi:STAS domain-containing protein [Actinoplanes sp. GCM10030250]|uniref:STAS domain-containing protein n=1 Tax=Actinoplanes sp. GCM10030250 TaxID=3273376 RepID=UPI0036111AEC
MAMASDILTVTVKDVPGAGTVIAVAGEIDRDSRDELRRAADIALLAGHLRLILDVGAVTFCDSSGLSFFVDLHRQTQAQGGWLRLAGASPDLRSMLTVTNLDHLLAVFPTVEQAGQASEQA